MSGFDLRQAQVCLDSEGNSILLHQLKPKPQH
jgi:hypothetical protein